MKKKFKKLALHTETLRNLNEAESCRRAARPLASPAVPWPVRCAPWLSARTACRLALSAQPDRAAVHGSFEPDRPARNLAWQRRPPVVRELPQPDRRP